MTLDLSAVFPTLKILFRLYLGNHKFLGSSYLTEILVGDVAVQHYSMT